jgi:D-glycero-D-manno-heptose 1,7-bisphosphate phosphatase
MKRAVFFDRDDTLIRNVPYLGDPTQVRLLPGAAAALRDLRAAGFALFIVSNHSGVGRGLITREQVQAVNDEMHRQLGEMFFDGVYNCYAAPEDPYAEDRKPSPLLVQRAAAEHALDLKRSFFVGDRLSDMQCGKNAGCRSVLVLTGIANQEQEDSRQAADFVTEDLAGAVRWILGAPSK